MIVGEFLGIKVKINKIEAINVVVSNFWNDCR